MQWRVSNVWIIQLCYYNDHTYVLSIECHIILNYIDDIHVVIHVLSIECPIILNYIDDIHVVIHVLGIECPGVKVIGRYWLWRRCSVLTGKVEVISTRSKVRNISQVLTA